MSLRAIVSSNVALKSPRAIFSPRAFSAPPTWNFEKRPTASTGGIFNAFAIARMSATPPAIVNSIELPNSLNAAARSPRSPMYQTSPVIGASVGCIDS